MLLDVKTVKSIITKVLVLVILFLAKYCYWYWQWFSEVLLTSLAIGAMTLTGNKTS